MSQMTSALQLLNGHMIGAGAGIGAALDGKEDRSLRECPIVDPGNCASHRERASVAVWAFEVRCDLAHVGRNRLGASACGSTRIIGGIEVDDYLIEGAARSRFDRVADPIEPVARFAWPGRLRTTTPQHAQQQDQSWQHNPRLRPGWNMSSVVMSR